MTNGREGASSNGSIAPMMLTDEQIKQYVNENQMIAPFVEECAKYASYELHASDIVEELIYHNSATAHAQVEISSGDILITPGATLKVYTVEDLRLPPNIVANVIGLGQLFACGINIGSTYVDPGSSGPIYLAMTNLSPRRLRIPVGEPIGRAQFFLLSQPVQHLHGGASERRRIGLRVESDDGTNHVLPAIPSDAAKNDSSDVATPNATLIDLRYRISLQKIVLYLLTGTCLGTLWATSRHQGNVFLGWLDGDGLPTIIKLLMPIFIAGTFGLLSRDVRRTARVIVNRWWMRAAKRMQEVEAEENG